MLTDIDGEPPAQYNTRRILTMSIILSDAAVGCGRDLLQFNRYVDPLLSVITMRRLLTPAAFLDGLDKPRKGEILSFAAGAAKLLSEYLGNPIVRLYYDGFDRISSDGRSTICPSSRRSITSICSSGKCNSISSGTFCIQQNKRESPISASSY
jgi:hypothetical protein